LILSPSIVYMYTTCLLIHELYILSFSNIPKGDTFLLSPHLFICQSFSLWWNNVLIRQDSFSTHKQHCCPLSATFSNLIIVRIVILTMQKFTEYQKIVSLNHFTYDEIMYLYVRIHSRHTNNIVVHYLLLSVIWL